MDEQEERPGLDIDNMSADELRQTLRQIQSAQSGSDRKVRDLIEERTRLTAEIEDLTGEREADSITEREHAVSLKE